MVALTRFGRSLLAAALVATLAAGAETALPDNGQLLPDLVILDAQVAGSNPDRLRIRVANVGLVAAVETRIELTYWRGGKATTMSGAVPMLMAGERQWLVMEVGAPPDRADAVVLRIDEPSFVIESDEGNNHYLYE